MKKGKVVYLDDFRRKRYIEDPPFKELERLVMRYEIRRRFLGEEEALSQLSAYERKAIATYEDDIKKEWAVRRTLKSIKEGKFLKP